MNKIYKTVWSACKATYIAVSENAKTQGKNSVTSSASKDRSGAISFTLPILKSYIYFLFGVLSLGTVQTAYAQVTDIAGDSNVIVTDEGGGSYRIGLTSSPVFAGNVAAGSVTAGNVTSTGNVSAANISTTGTVSAGAVTISSGGINAGNTKITNMADGALSTSSQDAVNGRQLNATNQNVSNLSSGLTATNQNVTNVSNNLTATNQNVSNVSSNLNLTNTNVTNLANALSNVTAGTGKGIKYFHANSTLADSAATGVNSIAVGPQANSPGANATAIGLNALSQDADSISLGTTAGTGSSGASRVAIGKNSGDSASGANATTIGVNAGSNAIGNETIAIGSNAGSRLDGANNIAIGLNANNFSSSAGADTLQNVTNATAIGANSGAYANGSVALGNNAMTQLNAQGSVAVGEKAFVAMGASNGTGVGRNSSVSGAGGAAFGANAQAGGNASAMGINAKALGGSSVAAGANASSNGLYSISIGESAGVGTAAGQAGSNITNPSNIAIGYQAGNNVVGESNIGLGTKAGNGTDGSFNIAIGYESKIVGPDANSSVAIGYGSIAGSKGSVALGSTARSTGSESIAIGLSSNASVGNSMALGSGARASHENSIALGAGSVSEAGVSSSYITNRAPSQSGALSIGSSVGSSIFQRRISNVADGALDYDAVNVKQLRQSNENVNMYIGGGVNVADTTTKFTVNGTTYSSIEEAFLDRTGNVTGGTTFDPLSVKYAGADGANINLTGVNGTAIHNVKDGVAATDAVNKGQLDATRVKFYSVTPEAENSNNYNNEGATAAGAMAAGVSAKAKGAYSTAIGYGSTAGQNETESSTTAIGHDARAMGGADATAIGRSSRANGRSAVSLGSNAQALDTEAIAIGSNATVAENILNTKTARQGIAIGANSHSGADRATALGPNAFASGLSSAAVGDRANATGENAFAGGTQSAASGANSIAVGTKANSAPTNSVAIGNQAKAGHSIVTNTTAGNITTTYGNFSTALGNNSYAGSDSSTAVGDHASANATNAAAVGAFANATGTDSAALGSRSIASNTNAAALGALANASGANATAVGASTKASGESAAALGASANASGANASALGATATANAANSTALGGGAQALAGNSVALGAGSMTATSYANTTARYSNVQNNDGSAGVVSVGSMGTKRRITNVAGGVDDTDAVNVRQLTSVVDMGMNFTANNGTAVHRKIGETLSVTGTGTTGSFSGSNLRTVTKAGGIEIQMTDTPNFTTVNTTNLNTTNITATGNTTVRNFTVAGDSVVNMGGNQIKNVAAGTNGTDVVNVNQLNVVNDTANKGWNVTSGKTGTGTVAGSTVTKVGPGDTAKFIAGDNIAMTQAGQNLTIATSMTPTFNTVNTTGDVRIGGNSIITGSSSVGQNLTVNGTTTLNGNTNVNNLTVASGSTVNMGGNQIKNVAAGTNGTDAVNVNQLTNTTTDLTNKGMNFAGNSGASVHRNLGDTLSITGTGTTQGTYSGANLRTITNNNGIEIQMTDAPNFTTVNTTNLNSTNVTTTNLTATGDTVLNNTTIGGPNATFNVSNGTTVNMGGNQITNVGAGVNTTDVVNVGQLEGVNTTANKGWNVTTAATGSGAVTGTSDHQVKPGDRATFTAGNNIDMIQDGANLTIATSMNPNFTTVNTTGNANIGGNLNVAGTTTLTGNTTVSNFTVTPNSTVNMGGNQIKNVAAGTNGTDAVNVNQLTNTTTDLTNKGMNFADNAGTSVHRDLGQTLNITGGNVATGNYSGDNLRTVANANGIQVQMTDAPNFTTVNTTNLNSTNVTTTNLTATGDTVLNNTTIGGPNATFNVSNGTTVNMGGNQITNVSAGVNTTDVVNVGQLENVNTTANKGWNLGVNDGSYQNIAPNGTVDLIAGSNMEVTRVGSNVTFGTSMTPTFTTVNTTGNANIGGNLNVAGTTTLTGNTTVSNFTVTPNSTVNMGGNQIKNVAAGTNGTDAVNVNQLTNTTTDLTNKGMNFADNAGTSVHRDLGQTLNITGGNVATGNYSGDNLRTVANANGIQVQMTDAPVFKTVRTTDLTVTGNTVLNNTTIGGPGATFNVANGTTVNMGSNRITNVGAGVDGTDAVNVDQLKEVNATANAGWNLGINDGTYQNIAPNGSVNLTAGANMKLTRDGANVTFATVDTPTFKTVNTTDLNVSGNTILNNTTIGGPGKTFNVANGTTVNMGGNQITNVGAGTNGTDAVNLTQLNQVNTTANKGWNLTANGLDSSNVKPGATVDFSAMDSNVVVGKSGNNIKVGIAQDLNLKSVTTGDTTLSDNGLVINGGPSVTKSGIDAGGKKITNVAAGTDLTDAVNVGQLRDVANIANAGWNIGDSNGLVGKVAPGSQVNFVAGNTNTRVNVTQVGGASQVQVSAAPSALQYTGTNNANGSNTPNADQFTPTNQVTLVGSDSSAPVSVNNVANAKLSGDSLQAVNGSQLYGLGESVANGLGGDSVFNTKTGKVETVLHVNGNTYNNVNDALGGIGKTANAGWNLQVDGDTPTNVAPGSKVGFNAGKNIVLERDGNNVKVSTAKDVTFTSVTTDVVSAKNVKVSESIGIIDGPKMNRDGIDAAGKTITNVAPGVKGTDAVNVNQLSRGLNQLDGKIERNKNDADGGTAAAMAMAGLPQAYLPGKSMFAIGGSTFQGQGGYAAGLSKVSENGSWVVKGAVSGSSRGQVGGTVGVGYQW